MVLINMDSVSVAGWCSSAREAFNASKHDCPNDEFKKARKLK
jgi:hypothetical protein